MNSIKKLALAILICNPFVFATTSSANRLEPSQAVTKAFATFKTSLDNLINHLDQITVEQTSIWIYNYYQNLPRLTTVYRPTYETFEAQKAANNYKHELMHLQRVLMAEAAGDSFLIGFVAGAFSQLPFIRKFTKQKLFGATLLAALGLIWAKNCKIENIGYCNPTTFRTYDYFFGPSNCPRMDQLLSLAVGSSAGFFGGHYSVQKIDSVINK